MRAQLLSRALVAVLFGICVALNIGTENQAIDRDDSSLGIPATTTFHHHDDFSLPTRRGRGRREINSPDAEQLNPMSHQADNVATSDGTTEPTCPPHKVCLAPGILAVIIICSCLGSLLFIGVPIFAILFCTAWNSFWD
ncbi:hypothetical protein GE21DRAFT_48 [Neurospora crassa]|uniref:Uncharacterized protein n=1 Tax=Neurospora crassa (strain ATCC 24698 / 74-OR23-1A / CBS 708.71 / DSM 1257 / FGSC 987) TaxID=367110 RepID=Q7SGK5_NEUCR|nr:hypothetical protein NCU08079 [Neurospora crassa OR74A]EAA35974.2 hypothetical protein NCU08079 [Neurospora crassa OR74A]KHE80663.1 hypothetical protein GE21DRAFT_48 [Neurospora crassa]|eukprot:XP_965210.2 hypothetical protein NCU08079 [Neurospora crassa OR74A]